MATMRTLTAEEISALSQHGFTKPQIVALNTQMETPTFLERIAAEVAKLSDRVTDAQVIANPEWMRAACEYAAGYSGNFSFMLDMAFAWKRNGALSVPQMRGTLNCLRAQEMRRLSEIKEKQLELNAWPAKQLNEIVDGFYTVSFEDGSHVTIRINSVSAKQARNGKAARYASYLNGPINTSDYARFAFVNGASYRPFKMGNFKRQIAALEILMGSTDATEFGRAYASESGNCWVCGRLLTDPESIAAGIGPICAGR